MNDIIESVMMYLWKGKTRGGGGPFNTRANFPLIITHDEYAATCILLSLQANKQKPFKGNKAHNQIQRDR